MFAWLCSWSFAALSQDLLVFSRDRHVLPTCNIAGTCGGCKPSTGCVGTQLPTLARGIGKGTGMTRFFRNDLNKATNTSRWVEITNNTDRPFHGVTFNNGPPVFGDIDGDGDMDAVAADASGKLRTFFQRGRPVEANQPSPLGAQCAALPLAWWWSIRCALAACGRPGSTKYKAGTFDEQTDPRDNPFALITQPDIIMPLLHDGPWNSRRRDTRKRQAARHWWKRVDLGGRREGGGRPE